MQTYTGRPPPTHHRHPSTLYGAPWGQKVRFKNDSVPKWSVISCTGCAAHSRCRGTQPNGLVCVVCGLQRVPHVLCGGPASAATQFNLSATHTACSRSKAILYHQQCKGHTHKPLDNTRQFPLPLTLLPLGPREVLFLCLLLALGPCLVRRTRCGALGSAFSKQCPLVAPPCAQLSPDAIFFISAHLSLPHSSLSA